MTRSFLPAALAAFLLSAAPATARAGFDHSHAAWTAILQEHVSNERVDYAALKKAPAPLEAYLDTLASVPESEFKGWSREQRLAFLINLYNAATLKLVADHYPVDSIKDIGGVFNGPWKQSVVRAFGKTWTLDNIEHDMIRPKYGEPRAHFAVNCASIGCPALRPEAFVADRLDAQLDEQGRKFLADPSKNRVDVSKKTLHLSPIFKWFASDFTNAAGSIDKFVRPYLSDADRAAVSGGGFRVSYTDYDWGLNEP